MAQRERAPTNSKQVRPTDASARRRFKTRAGNAKSAAEITPRRHFTASVKPNDLYRGRARGNLDLIKRLYKDSRGKSFTDVCVLYSWW